MATPLATVDWKLFQIKPYTFMIKAEKHKKLLNTVYIQIGSASSSFIQSYSNLAETFNTSIALDQKRWI